MPRNFIEMVNGKANVRVILDPCEGYIGKKHIQLSKRLEAEIRYWDAQFKLDYISDEFRAVCLEQLSKCHMFDVEAHCVFVPDWNK